VILTSPEPSTKENATVLATWTYGAGRTAVFTTDAGHRWANLWMEWDGYDQFFSQLIRFAMRPTGDRGKFSVATQLKDGKAKVIVTALDKNDDLLNFLTVAGDVIKPDMEAEPISMRQVAPGRYEGEFDATTPGSYFLSLAPGANYGLLRTGLSVPYSAEYRDRETNEELLKSLASMRPKGGQPGRIINVAFDPGMVDMPTVDTFRRDLAKSISTRDIWPLLVLMAGCIFLADVFVRRVAVSFDWVVPVAARMKAYIAGGEVVEEPDERMARLRSRKAEVTEEIDERRAATRFEPSPDEEVDMSVLDQSTQMQSDSRAIKEKESMTPTEEEDSYTARLLRAKQQARKDQNPKREL
jgi:hypothetical protein